MGSDGSACPTLSRCVRFSGSTVTTAGLVAARRAERNQCFGRCDSSCRPSEFLGSYAVLDHAAVRTGGQEECVPKATLSGGQSSSIKAKRRPPIESRGLAHVCEEKFALPRFSPARSRADVSNEGARLAAGAQIAGGTSCIRVCASDVEG